MWVYKSLSDGRPGHPWALASVGRCAPLGMLALALTLLAACSPRTLVLVDPCPDGATAAGTCLSLADASLSDAAPTTLLMGLVGHWHFDDGAGSFSASDSSGNGYDGTLVGLDPSTAWTTDGRLEGALETKAQGYASVPNSPRIDAIQSQVSLAAWVYLDGTISVYGTAVSKQIGSTQDQYYHLALNAEGRPNLFINNNSLALTADDPVAVQTWTHLAGTWDGSVARLYVNGKLVFMRNVSGTFARDPNPLLLGANGNNAMVSERFPGRIDEIELYDRALDANEVSQLASPAIF